MTRAALAEGVGRWHLASGSTILAGWRSMGAWTMVYFGVYIMVWGISFGAAAMSATALPLNALFPAVSVRAWGIVAGVVGFVLVGIGLDNSIAYLVTGVFVVAMMVVGTALLFQTGNDIGDEEGLVQFASSLQQRLGGGVRMLFLVGFLSASLLGVWNGVSLLFADFLRVARGIPDRDADAQVSETSPAFRFYLAWLTFPPMALLFLDQPVALVLVYTALGSIFMPYLAITLLWLLNHTIDVNHPNGWLSNIALGASALLFFVIAINEIVAQV